MLLCFVTVIVLIITVVVHCREDVLDVGYKPSRTSVEFEVTVIVKGVQTNVSKSVSSHILLNNFLVILLHFVLPILLAFGNVKDVDTQVEDSSNQNESNDNSFNGIDIV